MKIPRRKPRSSNKNSKSTGRDRPISTGKTLRSRRRKRSGFGSKLSSQSGSKKRPTKTVCVAKRKKEPRSGRLPSSLHSPARSTRRQRLNVKRS
jgi:hypothetical protein